MQNKAPSQVVQVLILFTFSLHLSGCTQNSGEVEKLQAEKDKLKAQIAELQGDKTAAVNGHRHELFLQ